MPPESRRAGADTFVSGSAIFGSADYARTIKAMRAQIEIGGKSLPLKRRLERLFVVLVVIIIVIIS